MYEIKYRDDTVGSSTRWDIDTRLKYYITLQSGGIISREKLREDDIYQVYGSNGIIGFYSKKNINGTKIIIGRVGSCGEINIASNAWISDNALIVNVYSNKINFSYLNYLLISLNLKEYANKTAQPLITGTIIKNLFCNIPEVWEQKKIANFLDIKTTQFDNIIAKKEHLIKKLEEAKKSLISEVVTGKVKIVDGQLVPRGASEMKDSGVEWLGMIPKEWDRTKLKNLVCNKITDGPHETPEFIDEGIPFLSAEAIVGSELSFDKKRGFISTKQHKIYKLKSKVKLNDILFCKSGSTTGKSALVKTDEEFGIWSPLAIIRANKKIQYKFLFYTIQSKYFRTQVENYWSFGTQPNIGMGTLESLYVSYSNSLEEQINCVNVLDNKVTNLDETIRLTEIQVKNLKIAKQSLISEAVTGKIDLRDWEIIEEGELQ